MKKKQAQQSSSFARDIFALMFVVLALAICQYQSFDMALLCFTGFAATLPILYAYRLWRLRPAAVKAKCRPRRLPVSDDPDDSWMWYLAALDRDGDGIPD